MQRVVLALVVLAAAWQASGPVARAQDSGGSTAPRLVAPVAAPPAQIAGALCAPGEVPLPETLYFRTGQVALAGCYPLTDLDDLRAMATLPRARWVCRTAVPSADLRDDWWRTRWPVRCRLVWWS